MNCCPRHVLRDINEMVVDGMDGKYIDEKKKWAAIVPSYHCIIVPSLGADGYVEHRSLSHSLSFLLFLSRSLPLGEAFGVQKFSTTYGYA